VVSLLRLSTGEARLLVLPDALQREARWRAQCVSWLACVVHPQRDELFWSTTQQVVRSTFDGAVLAQGPLNFEALRLSVSADGRFVVSSGSRPTTAAHDADSLRVVTAYMRSSATREPLALPQVNVLAMPNHGIYSVRRLVDEREHDGSAVLSSSALAVSPNGSRLASVRYDQFLRFGPRADGPVPPFQTLRGNVALADDGTTAFYGGPLSRDGWSEELLRRLTLLLPDGQLKVVDLEAAIARVLFSAVGCLVARVDGVIEVLSPEGQRLQRWALPD